MGGTNEKFKRVLLGNKYKDPKASASEPTMAKGVVNKEKTEARSDAKVFDNKRTSKSSLMDNSSLRKVIG